MNNDNYDYTIHANTTLDSWKENKVSAVIAMTETDSDGFYRVVVSVDGEEEKQHILDLLNCLAQASMALHARLDEIKDER